jgi:RecA-family ATPase
LSRGAALPGQEARAPVSVVLLSCEDDIADTVVPRLLAMGADLTRIVAIRGNQPEEGDTSRRLVTLSRDLDLVADVVAATAAARLLVIDPIAAYLGGTDANSNVEVRGILCALGEVAEQRNIAVLVVSHNRKSSQGRALHRVMGSLAFTATARSVLGVVADTAMEGRRLVIPLKSNVAIDQVGYAFKVTPEGRVEWETDPVLHWDEGDFTASVEDRVEETVERLRQMLAQGPRPAIEVQRELRKSGVSHHVLWDAKRRAHVRSRRDGDRYVWELMTDIDAGAAMDWADGRE